MYELSTSYHSIAEKYTKDAPSTNGNDFRACVLLRRTHYFYAVFFTHL
jgi:hypothetical protein